jgi:hypothetical protein
MNNLIPQPLLLKKGEGEKKRYAKIVTFRTFPALLVFQDRLGVWSVQSSWRFQQERFENNFSLLVPFVFPPLLVFQERVGVRSVLSGKDK